MQRKASELARGDRFRMHIYGEVIALESIAGGKRIKIRLSLEDQGQRTNSGFPSKGSHRGLEFTDAGHSLEFICRPGRLFHLIADWWDGEDEDELEPAPRKPADLVDA
jgi:hypothetical protein